VGKDTSPGSMISRFFRFGFFLFFVIFAAGIWARGQRHAFLPCFHTFATGYEVVYSHSFYRSRNMISPSIPDTRLSGNAIGGRPELLEFGKVIAFVSDPNVFNYSSQSVRSVTMFTWDHHGYTEVSALISLSISRLVQFQSFSQIPKENS